MSDDTISALIIDLQGLWYDPVTRGMAPRDLIRPYIPTNADRRAWVPQSMADAVWIFYGFKSVEERIAWENSLPALLAGMLNRRLVPEVHKYGWKTRDYNGFET